jgi:predicted dehydrogenase
MKRLTRREFVQGSIAAGVALGVPRLGRAASPAGKSVGPNSEVRLAIVGLGSLDTPGNVGGRGRQLIGFLQKVPGTRIVALCDVDQSHLDREVEELKKLDQSVTTYRDLRKVLDDKTIDAVMVATPNHWHALAGIWACQAGKDVFIEKPMSYNIWEGRQVVAAARKYGRIIQAGMEGRSNDALRSAFEFLRSGALGKIRHANVVCYRQRKGIGRAVGPTPIPATVDYDLWCGPAPVSPLTRKYLHYDWHWGWATGNGEIGNNGVHYLDLCRWGLELNRTPHRAMSIGGRFAYDDDGETPNTQVVLFDFDSIFVTCEVHGLPEKRKGGFRTIERGVAVQCEGGFLTGNFEGGTAYDNDGRKIREFKGSNFNKIQTQHVANFIDAVRSRKAGDLRADALQGHLSAACAHMANVSHRIGALSSPEAILERTQSNHELTDAFQRCRQHLKANDVDLGVTRGVLGPWVTLDPEKEQFVGPFAEQANALAMRTYRKPFVVPTVGEGQP